MALDVADKTEAGVESYQFYLPHLVQQWARETPAELHRQIDGTMVFVDISGFTAMSERLARFGKVGAEEVTDILGECFKGLLSVAYPLGGRLVKFGGDALLLLFDGDSHEARGVNAAVGMQTAMRTLGRVKTSAGNNTLRMSTGIHSGPFHFFLVGRSHRELIVTGPAATATVAMEASAEATEIVVSAETAAALPAAVVGEGNGAGFLVRRAVPDIDDGVVDVRPPPCDLEQYVPLAIRASILAGANEPEHRQVTVAFLHFMGADGLLSSDGPGAVSRALSELIGRVQDAIDPRGVTFLATDVYEDGGKIILAAGAPTATGNDSERMLLALREIADQDLTLAVRIGVNRGHVFAGDVGPAYRRTYTVMGDDVNLAARLMSAAQPGEIYATPVVLDNSRTLFATTDLEPFSVKGKSEPIRARCVGEEIGARSNRTREELPFTGRVEELHTLQQALERAQAGEGGVISIVGDRGIGKTRLLQEALACVPQVPFMAVRAEPYGTATPFRPFRDPLRQLLGVERADNQAMAEQLAGAIARLSTDLLPFLPLIADVAHIDVPPTPEVDTIEARFRRGRLADVLLETIGLAASGPLVFVLEEGQWMDEASTELAERICGATAASPWLVLSTRTGQDGGFEPAESRMLALEPLQPDEAKSIVVAVTEDEPLRPHDVAAIVQRAAGNPLYLEETLSVVRATGSAADLPDSLDALVSAQVDALPPIPRRLLRHASVLGSSFRCVVLAEILADDPHGFEEADLDALAGFLDSDGKGRYRFRHNLLRDVAYEGLSYRRRRELHSKAAQATERLAGPDVDSVADLLALHYSLAQEHEPAWHYARIAGDDAKASYANIDAAAQYERALQAALRLPEVSDAARAEVWMSLGDARQETGQFDDALEAYKKASRLVRDEPVDRARALHKRARARERSGAYSVALRELTTAQGILARIDSPAADRVRARVLAMRAQVHQAQERPRDALCVAQQAVDEARRAGNLEALGSALVVLDWAYLFLGQAEKATYSEEALGIYEQLGDLGSQAGVIATAGIAAYFEGRWKDALDLYERARDAFERAGNAVHAAHAGSNSGEVLVNQGRFAEAEPLLRESTRVLRASGFLDGAAFGEIHLARALAGLGDLEGAERLLRRALDDLRGLGASSTALEAATYLAEVRVLRGDPEGALSLLDGLRQKSNGEFVWQGATVARVRAAALAGLGRLAEASVVLESGLADARNHQLSYEQALLLRDRAELDRRAGREPDPTDLEDAASLLDDLGVQTS